MLVDVASEDGRADRPNEDFVVASAEALVLVDGAGTPDGTESGCRHGVAWFARGLASRCLVELAGVGTLGDGLAAAIDGVRSSHAGTCDVEHPGSPAATVVAVRVRNGLLEYLVLCDSVLAVDVAGGAPTVVSDDRLGVVSRELRKEMDALPTGSREHAAARRVFAEELRAYRNVAGGYWVASSEPAAADHAFTGAIPLTDVVGFALLSDGASRLADRFGVLTWAATLRTLREHGAKELIVRTRAAEIDDPDGHRWPRGKTHDDATCAYVRL